MAHSSTNNKKEGDKKTPKGLFSIGDLYFRSDRINKPRTNLKKITNGILQNHFCRFLFEEFYF